jgi:pyruvate/2-oxoglutarate dehydrogenase complex dihydrolipoamide acyltransferase (E2) component
MIEVRVPKWGLTMEEATVLEWLKSPGDRVESGEIIAVLETDKITSEIESPVSGVLVEIVAGVEEVIAVESVLATIDEDH